jgi:hypothetical protein
MKAPTTGERWKGPTRSSAFREAHVLLHSLNDLMQTRLHVADRKVTADEIFFDPGERKIRYLAVDIGGWFEVREVILAADLLDPPGVMGGGWSLRLDEAALDAAPRWHEGMSDETMDLTGWPPIIVGPFGGTYAPMLLYEQIVDNTRRDAAAAPEAGSGEEIVYRLERSSEWLGLLAFGRDGELGRIDDMLFDATTLRIERLVLGSGGLLSHRVGEVPLSALRHMANQRTHVVLDLSSEDVVADVD